MLEKTNSSSLVISLGSIVFTANPILKIIAKIKSQLADIELDQNDINTIFGFFQRKTNVADSKDLDVEFQTVLPPKLQNNRYVNIDNILNIMHEDVDEKHVESIIKSLRSKYTNIVFVTRSFARSCTILFTKIGNILPLGKVIKSSDFKNDREFLGAIQSNVLEFDDVKYCCADWIEPICTAEQRLQLQDILRG